jgi:hypothetical protein
VIAHRLCLDLLSDVLLTGYPCCERKECSAQAVDCVYRWTAPMQGDSGLHCQSSSAVARTMKCVTAGARLFVLVLQQVHQVVHDLGLVEQALGSCFIAKQLGKGERDLEYKLVVFLLVPHVVKQHLDEPGQFDLLRCGLIAQNSCIMCCGCTRMPDESKYSGHAEHVQSTWEQEAWEPNGRGEASTHLQLESHAKTEHT